MTQAELMSLCICFADSIQQDRDKCCFCTRWHRKSSCWLPPVYLKRLAWRHWHLKIHKLHGENRFFYSRAGARAITWQWLLINIGNASNIHQHFLPNRWVTGCYFSARRDANDHIENTEHNYNGVPAGPRVEAQQRLSRLGRGKEGDGPIKLQALSRVSCECPRRCRWPSVPPGLCSRCSSVPAQNTIYNTHACSNVGAPKSCTTRRGRLEMKAI